MTSFKIARACRTSSTAPTKGNMMRSGPCADARTSARSCVRSTSGIGQAETEAAQAGPRAAALRALRRAELPLVEVEGPDRDRTRRDLFDQAAIDLVLRVFRGGIERPARQHELRAVQADALGAVRVQERQVFEQLDVGFEPDPHAVGGRDRADLGRGGAGAPRLGRPPVRVVDLFRRSAPRRARRSCRRAPPACRRQSGATRRAGRRSRAP